MASDPRSGGVPPMTIEPVIITMPACLIALGCAIWMRKNSQGGLNDE